MSYWGKLDRDKNVVLCEIEDMREAGGLQRVALTNIIAYGQSVDVSTVFLMVAHGYDRDMWFETMVFEHASTEESEFGWQTRYPNWRTAMIGHRLAVRQVFEDIRARHAHLLIPPSIAHVIDPLAIKPRSLDI